MLSPILGHFLTLVLLHHQGVCHRDAAALLTSPTPPPPFPSSSKGEQYTNIELSSGRARSVQRGQCPPTCLAPPPRSHPSSPTVDLFVGKKSSSGPRRSQNVGMVRNGLLPGAGQCLWCCYGQRILFAPRGITAEQWSGVLLE